MSIDAAEADSVSMRFSAGVTRRPDGDVVSVACRGCFLAVAATVCAELLLKKPLLRPETEADGCWVGVGVGEAAGVVGWTANPVACFETTTAGVRTGNVLGQA